MRIIDCEQKSPEWYAARLGVPTASEFGRIITDKKMEYAAGAATYINELIDELYRPDAERGFSGNRHTERGNLLEDEARDLYAIEADVIPQRTGFILSDDGMLGCSPDSLVGTDGGLEIKAPDGPKHIEWLRAGGLPLEHRAQIHGSLIITGRDWWDFLSYCPGYPRIMIRVTPDKYTVVLRSYLARFTAEYADARQAFAKILLEAA